MEWINVKDKLPPKSDHKRTNTVLLWVDGLPKSPYLLGYGIMNDGVNYPYTIREWAYTDSTNDMMYGTVTHWMPLPKPPIEQGE